MTMTKQEFLAHADVRLQTLDLWLEQRWLIPDQTSGEMHFSDMDVGRAHLIQDLKSDLGVNDEGVDVILHLLDQLHGLRRVLNQLHGDLQQRTEDRDD